MKKKISDEQIIELIEQGENNTGIAKKLEVTVGGLNERIKQLRKEHVALPKVEESKKILPVAEQPIDLQKLDTVRIGDIRYRVTGIEQDCLLLREVMSDEERKWSRRKPELLVIKKQDYLDGKTGIVKQDTPPVTSYIDTGLIDKPETKQEPEVAPEPEQTPEPDYIDPEWGISEDRCRATDQTEVVPETDAIAGRIMAKANKDISTYRDIRNRIVDSLERGTVIMPYDLGIYNSIIIKYTEAKNE